VVVSFDNRSIRSRRKNTKTYYCGKERI